MDNKYLNSKEYNSLVHIICHSAEYILNEEKYDLILDKLYKITEKDIISKEEINHPITNS